MICKTCNDNEVQPEYFLKKTIIVTPINIRKETIPRTKFANVPYSRKRIDIICPVCDDLVERGEWKNSMKQVDIIKKRKGKHSNE